MARLHHMPFRGDTIARAPRPRRGFTLLEVMLAVGILAVALVILVETQSTAAQMTFEADRIVAATQLAQEKLAEVRLLVEREGFSEADVHEEGDFDDFGDDAVNAEFADLDDYHYEFLITQVDLGLAGDLTATANNLAGNLAGDSAALPADAIPDLGSFGISEDMIAQMLEPFMREARVRVWWGDDLEEAEENGNEVVLTTHIINPAGNMMGGLPGGGGNNLNPNSPNNPNNPRTSGGGGNPGAGGARNPGNPRGNQGGRPGANPFGGRGGGGGGAGGGW